MPIGTGLEEGFHAKRSAPVEVVGGIAAVSEKRGHWNDSLVLIVGERHVNVDYPRA